MSPGRAICALLIVVFATGPAAAYYPQWLRTPPPSAAASFLVSAVDFNGDSIPDVVTGSGNRAIVHFVQEGAVFRSGASFTFTASYLEDVAAGDVDGNGTQDLIVADLGTNTLTVIPGNGDGTFATPVATQAEIAPSEIATGDFNEDGHLDVLVRSYSAAKLALFVGDGSGRFAQAASRSLSLSSVDMTTGDLDGDGHLDVLVVNRAPVALELYFGAGDGTFPATTLLDETVVPTRVKFADLDADGDSEIISIAFYENSLSVRLNYGSRSFGPETVYYPLAIPPGYERGNPEDFVVFDATEDGNADVVLTLANEDLIATFEGTGTGFLEGPTTRWTGFGTGAGSEYLPVDIAAADFTRDGRPDLAILSAMGQVSLFRNVTGGLKLSAHANYPTISEGQTVRYAVTASLVDGPSYRGGDAPVPYPTGRVTIRSGDLVLASAAFDGFTTTMELSTLDVGTHTLTAHFEGDDEFYPASSAPLTQTVVAERTTAHLETSSPAELAHGVDVDLVASATSTDGQPVSGAFFLYTNGQRSQFAQSSGSWTLPDLDPGTHEFYATFEGTPTQPPSRSNTVTRTVTKGTPRVTLPTHDVTVTAGEESRIDVTVRVSGRSPSGRVRLYSSSTLIGTVTRAEGSCCGNTFAFDLSSLAPGVHHLRAFYDGDFRYHPAVSSDPFEYRVVPSAPLYVDARVRGTYLEVTAHHSGYEYGNYNFLQRIGRGLWTSRVVHWPVESVTSAPERVVYTFRMDKLDANGKIVVMGNMDIAMRFPFTDQPLMPGDAIRARHVTELVEAANLVRFAAGMPGISLNDVAPGQPMRAEHIAGLRTAINDARVRLGADPAAFSTDLGSGLPIRAHHIQELREAMQ